MPLTSFSAADFLYEGKQRLPFSRVVPTFMVGLPES
jgi:hypothetical protein